MTDTDQPPTGRPARQWETPHGAGDPATEGRKALHAYVSDDAHDHWHGFAAEQACSVSALLEAIAPSLDFDGPHTGEAFEHRLSVWVKAARKIDAARRRRRR